MTRITKAATRSPAENETAAHATAAPIVSLRGPYVVARRRVQRHQLPGEGDDNRIDGSRRQPRAAQLHQMSECVDRRLNHIVRESGKAVLPGFNRHLVVPVGRQPVTKARGDMHDLFRL